MIRYDAIEKHTPLGISVKLVFFVILVDLETSLGNDKLVLELTGLHGMR